MRIVRHILTISGFTFLSRIFGLIREIMLSHILGASLITDAFFVAFKFPNFFRRIFAEGAFNAAFVPMFSRKVVSEGQAEAKVFAEQVFSLMLTFLTIFVILVVTFTPTIIHILAPGFATTPQRLELAIHFTRITFPYILFISLAAHLSGILNSFDRFAAAAGVPILLNIIMIAALVICPVFELPVGTGLSIAVAIAGVVQLAWLYWACMAMDFRIRIRKPQLTPAIKELLRLMLPGAIGAGAMNINLFLDTVLASFLPEKSVSYIFYADRLNQLPLSILGIAIGTALLPLLSRQLKAGEYEQASRNKLLATEVALQLTIPAAAGLFILSYPLINLIYGMPKADSQATAAALAAFSIGIPAYVLNKVFVTSFFARQDTATPVKIAVGCIIFNFLLNLALMRLLGHVALALSTSLAAWVNVAALYYFLRKRQWFIIPIEMIIKCLKISLVTLVMAALLWALGQDYDPQQLSIGQELVSVLGRVMIGLFAYLSLGVILKVIDFTKIRAALKV
ncbi:murein biosynthesis integral membrane protein MurJ [Candidatus Odyssella thessalonicensis]|uniref:murein biosynthesis integral membrane protein MurJ n=1 Tax=Candidatus Odyssella thessalonicensis TaxID=84647 RepID=UPI000225B945|nr:murein biosynthesis integral membrane protein MurJ [Candidatus Odyssella thessalonicensis]